MGDYANATAAWAANYQGVATVAGDYYWQTSGTNGLFECTTSNASSQRYRAGSDHLPLEACFVASGVTPVLRVFDITDPLMPLWKQFTTGTLTLWGVGSSPDFTSVSLAWNNGKLIAGKAGGSNGRGLSEIDFRNDVSFYRATSAKLVFKGKIADALTGSGYATVNTTDTLNSAEVVGIAAYSGYIAAATAAGVSVIKPDGTVVKSSSTNAFKSVSTLNGRLYAINDTASPEQLIDFGPIDKLGASFTPVNTWTNATVPALSAATLNALGIAENRLIVPSASAVDTLWPNTAVLADSLIARKGTTFATPPIKKPEVMLICSTVEGAVTDANNYIGNFTTGVDGWVSAAGNTTVTWDEANQRLLLDRIEAISSVPGQMSRPNTLTVGKYYLIEITLTGHVSTRYDVVTGTIINGPSVGYYEGGTDVTRRWVIRANGTNFSIQTSNRYGVTSFPAINIIEVPYNFAKSLSGAYNANNYATIHGTLTATAEVAGGVAGLSGWNTVNYLSRPFNSALQVSTGDILVPFAFKCTGNSAVETLFSRGDTGMSSARLEIFLQADGTVRASINGTAVLTSASVYDDSLVHTGLFYRQAGVAYLEVDGQIVASAANTTDLDNGTAIVTVGVRPDTTLPASTSTIWFVGASATSPSPVEAALMHSHMRNLILNKANLDEIPSALAYSPLTKAVEMVGATKRQTLIDGAITSSLAHGQGTTPAVGTGSRGEIAIGGTTGVTISARERNLREYEARLTKERFTVLYAGNATGSRDLFPLPTSAAEMAVTIDAKPVRVSNAGVVQTEGAADDYTIKDYGLGRYVVQFAVDPADGNDVLIEFEREVYK
ncbi:MAG: hypothetical protein Q7L07_03405 [Pseudohongiella sp.]|nr:hypothetical protein [Pseudohongiella sp.]